MPIYLIARLIVRYGKLAEFSDIMKRLGPLMETHGWKLNAAYSTIVGNIHEVYDVWEVPDANSVPAGLAAAGGDPSFLALIPELALVVESETLTMVTKAPFSP